MKKRIADLFTGKKVTGCIAALALAVVIGGVALWQSGSSVPELPEYTDPVMEGTIEKEETPLAGTPKTTTKTTKKTTKKNVTLAKAATKTYTETLPTKTQTSTKTTKSSTATVKTVTTVKTATKEKYTKKSKVKVVTTTVTTTVKTTTTPLSTAKTSEALTTASSGTAAKKGKYEVSVTALAPKMDSRVLNAYQTMGFKVYVDSSVSYGGYFNARDRSITLREESDNIYHELGHFLAFISGNTDQTSSFKGIYNQEKGQYVGYNKAYVTKDNAEYYAESTKDYMLSGSSLKSSRPNTYAAIESSLNKVTDAQVSKLMKIYAAIWK